MTAKNVLPKVWKNGEWVELHIVTKAANVLTDDAKTLQQKAEAFDSHAANSAIHITQQERTRWDAAATKFSVYKSGKDENGIFTVVEYKRSDGKLYARSELSGGVSPQYTTRTITYYDADGTTVLRTDTYSLTYDADGELISEVKQ